MNIRFSATIQARIKREGAIFQHFASIFRHKLFPHVKQLISQGHHSNAFGNSVAQGSMRRLNKKIFAFRNTRKIPGDQFIQRRNLCGRRRCCPIFLHYGDMAHSEFFYLDRFFFYKFGKKHRRGMADK